VHEIKIEVVGLGSSKVESIFRDAAKAILLDASKRGCKCDVCTGKADEPPITGASAIVDTVNLVAEACKNASRATTQGMEAIAELIATPRSAEVERALLQAQVDCYNANVLLAITLYDLLPETERPKGDRPRQTTVERALELLATARVKMREAKAELHRRIQAEAAESPAPDGDDTEDDGEDDEDEQDSAPVTDVAAVADSPAVNEASSR